MCNRLARLHTICIRLKKYLIKIFVYMFHIVDVHGNMYA